MNSSSSGSLVVVTIDGRTLLLLPLLLLLLYKFPSLYSNRLVMNIAVPLPLFWLESVLKWPKCYVNFVTRAHPCLGWWKGTSDSEQNALCRCELTAVVLAFTSLVVLRCPGVGERRRRAAGFTVGQQVKFHDQVLQRHKHRGTLASTSILRSALRLYNSVLVNIHLWSV